MVVDEKALYSYVWFLLFVPWVSQSGKALIPGCILLGVLL